MPAKKTKECPYCWEKIMETAIKCRFCWEFLEEQPKNNNHAKKEKEQVDINEPIVFGVSKLYLGFFWFVWIWLFLFGSRFWWLDLPPGIICYFLGLWAIITAIEQHFIKLELYNDRIVYKRWIIVKRRDEIPYKKINSVDSKIFILDDLILRTWNDKPVIFKNLGNCKEAIKLIKEKIDY